MTVTPPRAALLTPQGRGAIAVIRVWGTDAIDRVEALFRPYSVSPRTSNPRLGRLGLGQGDEVVLVSNPTATWVEIQGHGGPAAIASVLNELDAVGVPTVSPMTWLFDDSPSTLVAEALIDLTQVETDRSAEILLDQAEGALDRQVQNWIERLSHSSPSTPAQILAEIEQVLARAALGRRLVEGWTVLLAGPPNAGKSSLFNALVGFDRSIVDPTPGTTRDIVSRRTAIAGWPVTFLDTAGLRAAADPLEAEGVTRTRERGHSADLILLVADHSQPLDLAIHALRDDYPAALAIASKSDLTPAWSAEIEGMLPVSAHSTLNLDILVAAIAHRIAPNPPGPGEPVPTRPRHTHGLETTIRLIQQAEIGQAIDTLKRLRHDPAAAQRASTEGGSGT